MIEWKLISGKTGYIKLDDSLVVTYDINGRDMVMIDSGYRESPELLAWLREEGKRVAAVLCTHIHVDHIGNNGMLQREFGAKIYVTEREFNVQQERFSSDDKISFEWMGREKYFFGDSGRYETTVIPSSVSGRKKTLAICGADFEIVPLPGHSPDHVGFETPDGVLHIGDAMMSDMVLKKSKVPYEMNISKTLNTLEKIARLDHPYLVASHRAVIPNEDIAAIAQANIDYHNDMLDEIERRLNGWQEMDKFITEVIGNRGVRMRLTRNIVWLPVAVKSYIDHLIREGRVECRFDSVFARSRRMKTEQDGAPNVKIDKNVADFVKNETGYDAYNNKYDKVYIKRTGKSHSAGI